jgi:group I intron endonuclease
VKSGIYEILNKTNGHRYVGSAVNLKRRWRAHKRRLFGGTHENEHLQNAWNKYGADTFGFEVLERWEPEFLVGMEQWWMNMLRPEYNIAPVAGSMLGHKHTDEARANMSAAGKGRVLTKEHKANLSAARRGRLLAKEHKANISAALMGHSTPPETRAKISAALKRRRK